MYHYVIVVTTNKKRILVFTMRRAQLKRVRFSLMSFLSVQFFLIELIKSLC